MNDIFRTLPGFLVLAILSVTASAETITVCAKGCDYTSINTAIDAASNGDVIQLSAETYLEGEQIDTDGKAITLRGVLDKAGEPASVLDGGGMHRVLICQSGETGATIFENLVIQNGYGQLEDFFGEQREVGGGMYNASNSSPTLTDCTFTSNSANYGGGMYNDDSSPTLTDCTFTDNSANYGGGMYNYGSNSSPTLTDCAFTGNSAINYGGGMYNDDSSPTLTDCAFMGNSANFGGGMRNISSSPTLTDCAFMDNSAGSSGGGMFNSGGTSTLTDCTFTGNSAINSGGGMRNTSSSLTLTDCTLTGNSAGSLGGGMYNIYSSPTLADCTFTDNSANYGGGMYNYGSNSSPTLTSCTFMECCQVDPPRSFVDAGGNDYDSWCDDCRADVNCRDNEVNAEDLGYLLARWDTDDPQCDLDGDGVVRAADLGLLFAAWGPCD